jgi:molecular chaperone GrpE (heat shock protein)
MLDPLTALSLAGNIAQFVDFSGRIISRTRELTKSSHRTTQEAYNAEILIRDLVSITEQVKDGARSASASSPAEEDKALEALCDGCIILSERMIKRLEKLKLEEGAGKRQAFLHALKSVWSQRELESEESQLATYRSQLEFRVLTSFR